MLKEELSLTDWFLHCKLDAALRARLICKGTNSAGEPWVSGYVTARLQPRLLLTKSRRYRLQGRMDEQEMQREGWSSDSRAAFKDGLPVDWETRLDREMLRKRQAEDGDDEPAEAEAVSGRKQGGQREDDSSVQQAEPSAFRVSRPRRSPAPLKLWKSSEWSEAELLRLVEAQLELDGEQDGRQLWASVAGAVGNGRTGEECRRKFEEFKREQQTSIAHAAQQQTEKEAKEEEEREDQDEDAVEEADSDSDGGKQSEGENDKGEEEAIDSDEAREEKAKARPKQPRARKTSSSAASRARNTARKPKPKPQQSQPQPPRRQAPEKQTAKSKPPSRPPARPSPRTPVRIAEAPMSHLAVSLLTVAHAVSRRSGRALMAPLRYWELEREVNGVVVRGWDIDDLQYRRAREEVERSHRQMRQDDDGDDCSRTAEAAREEGRLRRAAAGKWRQEEKALLWTVYRELEPTTPFFWSEVSRRLGGWRSAEDCQAQLQQMFPTPKKRGKRKQPERKEPQQAEEEAGGAQQSALEADAAGGKRKRKRATTRKREIRQALEARDAEHGGDDLFNSTPFKHDRGLAADGADSSTAAAASSTSQPQQQRGAAASSSRAAVPAAEQDEDEEDGVVFPGDPSLADVTVQRVMKGRRRVRAQVGEMLEAEKRRRREAAALQDEEEEDERAGLQRLEDERQERRQQAEDEMQADSAEDEGEEDNEQLS